MPKNDPAGRAGPTCRRRTKTVLAEVGPALIEVACDRNGSVELAIVPKRVHRKEGVDQIVLSLTSRRLTSGEVVTHFTVYGAKVSRDTISRITDAVLEVINERLEAQQHAGGVQVYAHVAGHLRRQVADPTGRSARVLTPPRCSGVLVVVPGWAGAAPRSEVGSSFFHFRSLERDLLAFRGSGSSGGNMSAAKLENAVAVRGRDRW